MTTLFVTGSSGFLGSAMLRKLDPSRFDTITLLSRSSITLPERLAKAENVELVLASIDDVDKYRQYLNSETVIVHLAAVTGKAAPDQYFKVNTEGTRKLIETAKSAGARKFILISSIAVSFKDRAGYLYADSKEQAEAILKGSGLDYYIVRPTIILGDNSPIWESFRKLASSSVIVLPGNGSVKIQPVFVTDVVDLILLLAGKDVFDNEVLEIGGPEIVTMDEFLTRIHLALKNTKPHILHLPLGFLVASLRIFERMFPSLLPVNSGQFASFSNDGVAEDNSLTNQCRKDMKDISNMLDYLVKDNVGGR